MKQIQTIKNRLGILLLATFVALLLSPTGAVAATPTASIQGAIDGVIKILNTDSLKGDAKRKVRRDKIRSAIGPSFSFEAMGKRSLGKHWKKLTDAEKSEFVKVFGTMIENSYINKLEKYTDEKVLYEKETIRKSSAEVRTKVVTSSGTKIPINYRMSNKTGDWLVYDVVVEGVSLVRNYRSQFAQVLKKEPIGTLITTLREKSAKSM
jgi:phospholipid transport system substrate-binding protein